MIVKICAVKNIEDANLCLLSGADIIGILVGQKYNSTDFVSKEVGKNIIKFINKRCKTCLVTHLTNADEIIELCKYLKNDFLQLHSNIEENQVKKILDELPNLKLLRLISVLKNGEIYTNIFNIKYVDYYIIDTIDLSQNKIGGTGIKSNWTKCAELIKLLNKPTFLAGGLTPENVKEAITIVKPFGVDVNTGCKNNIGGKDLNKLKQFIKNAKNCNIVN